MKRFLSALLALCLALCLAGCSKPSRVRDFGSGAQTRETAPPDTTAPSETVAPETQPAQSTITPALYKVTDEVGHVVWLFGSIHVGLPSFYPLPDYVTEAYENADALAVECDVVAFASDLGAQMDVLTGMTYSDGTSIRDHIPQELYTRSVEILEETNTYLSALDVYKPILWSTFIDNSLYASIGADSELGIDMHFLNDAHETGKEILEVESVQFQYDMLSDFSEELQIMLLEGSVYGYENPEESEAQMQSLLDTWASGDADALFALLSEEGELETEEEKLLYREYNDAMIVQRNLSMADYAEEVLASGEQVFICVGAAHVVGPGAMADLLAQRGYTVEKVLP